MIPETLAFALNETGCSKVWFAPNLQTTGRWFNADIAQYLNLAMSRSRWEIAKALWTDIELHAVPLCHAVPCTGNVGGGPEVQKDVLGNQ